jgi:peptide/nickel transport system substrate-binding protein
MSTDGTLYTFHLRTGVRFSSGNELTADDVVFSLKRAVSAQGCESYTVQTGFPDLFASIDKVDTYTVAIRLKHADPIFLLPLSQQIGIIDSKTLNAHGGLTSTGDAWIATHDAGSGPFTVESYEPESQIVLVAHKDYWGGIPGPSKLVIRIVSDPSTMELLTQSGAIDIANGIPFHDLARFQQNKGFTLLSHPSPYYVNICNTFR